MRVSVSKGCRGLTMARVGESCKRADTAAVGRIARVKRGNSAVMGKGCTKRRQQPWTGLQRLGKGEDSVRVPSSHSRCGVQSVFEVGALGLLPPLVKAHSPGAADPITSHTSTIAACHRHTWMASRVSSRASAAFNGGKCCRSNAVINSHAPRVQTTNTGSGAASHLCWGATHGVWPCVRQHSTDLP